MVNIKKMKNMPKTIKNHLQPYFVFRLDPKPLAKHPTKDPMNCQILHIQERIERSFSVITTHSAISP